MKFLEQFDGNQQVVSHVGLMDLFCSPKGHSIPHQQVCPLFILLVEIFSVFQHVLKIKFASFENKK
jgi:hypothetical protein